MKADDLAAILASQFGVSRERAAQAVETLDRECPDNMQQDTYQHVTLMAAGLSWDEADDLLRANKRGTE